MPVTKYVHYRVICDACCDELVLYKGTRKDAIKELRECGWSYNSKTETVKCFNCRMKDGGRHAP